MCHPAEVRQMCHPAEVRQVCHIFPSDPPSVLPFHSFLPYRVLHLLQLPHQMEGG